MHFWRSKICANRLDVQETAFCLAQLTEAGTLSLSAGLRMNGIHAFWSVILAC